MFDTCNLETTLKHTTDTVPVSRDHIMDSAHFNSANVRDRPRGDQGGLSQQHRAALSDSTFDDKLLDFKKHELAKRYEKRDKAAVELAEAEDAGDAVKVVQMQMQMRLPRAHD